MRKPEVKASPLSLRQQKLIKEILEHQGLDHRIDECDDLQGNVESNSRDLSDCIRCALICTLVGAKSFKLQLQMRCCTHGQVGIWIGFPQKDFDNFVTKALACYGAATGPIDPLGFTIINPPR